MAAPPASATTVLETFGASGPTGPLELQISETINQPASVTQGSNITISIPSGGQVVPTSQSGATVNFITGLTTIIPVPPQSTFVPGSVVQGNWSFTDTSSVTTTGAYTVTECTGPLPGVCTANPPSASPPVVLGPGTSTPYLEATTGSAQFSAGGTLTLPAWSFDVTATGTGNIVSTVSEFDTAANVFLPGIGNIQPTIIGYPAVVESGCITSGGTCSPQPPYQFQPIASTAIIAPPLPPVLQPQSGVVSAGQCTTINALNGATEQTDTPNPASVTVTTDGTAGHATANGDGTVTYCNTPGGTATTDTFQVTAASTQHPALVSNPVTETINISYNQCSPGGNPNSPPYQTLPNLGSGGSFSSPGTCQLHQEIVLPVTPGQIVLSQSNGLPLDVLGSSFCGPNPTVPGIVLNGQEQAACGRVEPLTVTNATGLDTGWTLTGQVTDFNDPGDPGITCDTPGTYSNHCIPGGNVAWEPDGAVGHAIVPGDTAQVTPGALILPFAPVGGSIADPLLAPDQGGVPNGVNPAQPFPVQPNPVVEPSPNAGLHTAAQTMCSAAAGQSGGTFVCGAGLELLIPASVAEPAGGSYLATLTETLF